ncbi:helix-turn-helix domain-containing protein [Streptomyces antimycoticus]|uniref:helix-turn-helix domain-containing protein n=1 Tax=Streptomyces antimycoticus TaxID=68175 RepID=UPI003441F511
MTAKLEDLPRLPRGKKLIGEDRERFCRSVSVVYDGDPNVSIRDISKATGRSFGFIRTMLIEAGIKLRSRGQSALCGKALEN